jgi:hypothetical protein
MYIELSINSIYALLTQIFKEQPIKGKDKCTLMRLSLPLEVNGGG